MPALKTDHWQRAVSFAARAHRAQTRRDGKTPYVAHVMRVALTLRHVFDCQDEVALTAALLHDTIEDTTTDFDDIAGEFGAPVAEIVAALTKNMTLPKARREPEYDARLAKAGWRARIVKLADVYDNAFDSTLNTRAERAKMAEKCRRALRLARADAARPETKRAIAAVNRVLKRLTSR